MGRKPKIIPHIPRTMKQVVKAMFLVVFCFVVFGEAEAQTYPSKDGWEFAFGLMTEAESNYFVKTMKSMRCEPIDLVATATIEMLTGFSVLDPRVRRFLNMRYIRLEAAHRAASIATATARNMGVYPVELYVPTKKKNIFRVEMMACY